MLCAVTPTKESLYLVWKENVETCFIYVYMHIYVCIYIKLNVIYHKTLLYLSMHPDLYDCFPNCKVIVQANEHYLFCSVEFCTLSPYFVRCGCETLFSSRAQSSVWLKLMIIYSFSI